MSESAKQIHVRLPAWMHKRFLAVTERGERSRMLRKKIMEIVKEREVVNNAKADLFRPINQSSGENKL